MLHFLKSPNQIRTSTIRTIHTIRTIRTIRIVSYSVQLYAHLPISSNSDTIKNINIEIKEHLTVSLKIKFVESSKSEILYLKLNRW